MSSRQLGRKGIRKEEMRRAALSPEEHAAENADRVRAIEEFQARIARREAAMNEWCKPYPLDPNSPYEERIGWTVEVNAKFIEFMETLEKTDYWTP